MVRGRAAGRRADPAPATGPLAPADSSAGGTPRNAAVHSPERDEIYRHAARQARTATEHIRRCTVSDPAAAADGAWAAADTLHAAARVLWNPHLRCAADSYDRAAYGRIPARSHDGDQLRRTARLVALAGNLTGNTMLMAIALMGQLVALAAAVAELRQAQQHAAQAAAARAAAAHLHSAVTQARAQVPHFGHAHAPRPDKAASATHVARRDFPAGWKPTQSVVDGENPQRSYSPPQPRRLPSQRASPGRSRRYG